MKTVGIITTFRQPNFGSVLQAFALQYIVERMGYDTKVIDYKYPNDFHWDAGLQFGRRKITLRNRLGDLKRKIQLSLGLRKPTKMEMMNLFIKKEMKCTVFYPSRQSILDTPPLFDIYVSGSDQIWNPNTMFGDMTYMFDFAPKDRMRIAYSSSFSCDKIPHKFIASYKENLNSFKSIGVRETNGVKLLKENFGRNDAQLVLDPTLLLTKEEWHIFAQKSQNLNVPKRYILFYMLAYTYSPEEKMCELLNFVQQKYQLPIVSLSKKPEGFQGEFVQIEDKCAVGNYEFLQLFERAEMVVTSSFHGTAYSLNFGKPLLALENGKVRSDDRISSLLNSVGLTSQLVFTDTLLTDEITPYYSKEREQVKLQELREKSLAYLSNSLKD